MGVCCLPAAIGPRTSAGLSGLVGPVLPLPRLQLRALATVTEPSGAVGAQPPETDRRSAPQQRLPDPAGLTTGQRSRRETLRVPAGPLCCDKDKR